MTKFRMWRLEFAPLCVENWTVRETCDWCPFVVQGARLGHGQCIGSCNNMAPLIRNSQLTKKSSRSSRSNRPNEAKIFLSAMKRQETADLSTFKEVPKW